MDFKFNLISFRRGTAAFSAQRFKSTNRQSVAEGKKAALGLETSIQLSARFNLSEAQGTFALPQFSLKGSRIEDTCPTSPVNCPDSLYRTIDGSCNNKNQTLWGRANTPLQRLLPSQYEDGLEKPRISNLPSPRAVSSSTTSSQVTSPNNKFKYLELLIKLK